MSTAGVVVLALTAAGLYGAGAVCAWRDVGRAVRPGRRTESLALAGVAAQTGALLWPWVSAGRVAFAGGAAGSLGLFAVCAGVAYLLLGARCRGPWWGALMLPVAALASLAGGVWQWYEARQATALSGASFGPGWALVHIVPTVVGIVCLAAGAALCVMYLVEEGYLRGRRLGETLQWLPALETLDRLSGWALGLAFGLLSVGLVTGTIRALFWQQLGAGWALDPKVLSSAVTWVFVGAVLVVKRRNALGGRRLAYLVVLAALLAAFTYVGVDALLGGRHAGLRVREESRGAQGGSPGDKPQDGPRGGA